MDASTSKTFWHTPGTNYIDTDDGVITPARIEVDNDGWMAVFPLGEDPTLEAALWEITDPMPGEGDFRLTLWETDTGQELWDTGGVLVKYYNFVHTMTDPAERLLMMIMGPENLPGERTSLDPKSRDHVITTIRRWASMPVVNLEDYV